MKEMKNRPGWDAYFLAMAVVASTRSTCIRRRIGAILVLDNRILATGYNGSPSGTRHCVDIGCLRQQLNIPSGSRHEICRGSHAEMNAIAQAAASGTKVCGGTMYTTHEPCSMCSKLIINSGCARVVYLYPYPDELSRILREEAGLLSDSFKEEEEIGSVLAGCLGGCGNF